jgi:hypothetical protein
MWDGCPGTKPLNGHRRAELRSPAELGQNTFALAREQTLRNVLLLFQTELASNLRASKLTHQRDAPIRNSDRTIHGEK